MQLGKEFSKCKRGSALSQKSDFAFDDKVEQKEESGDLEGPDSGVLMAGLAMSVR